MMTKKLVVSFPGGRGYEIPLLYFGAKHFEDLGYDKIFINHPKSADCSFDELFENAERIVKDINFDEFEDVVFIAKSIGTLVACNLKEKYKINNARLILLTPLPDTLKYISNENKVFLVALGTKDKYLDFQVLETLCKKENVSCYIEPNVGHRMEVMSDLSKNLEIVFNVIKELER